MSRFPAQVISSLNSEFPPYLIRVVAIAEVIAVRLNLGFCGLVTEALLSSLLCHRKPCGTSQSISPSANVSVTQIHFLVFPMLKIRFVVYANSLLATLNSRQAMRDRSFDTANTVHLSEIDFQRSSSSRAVRSF